MLRHAWILLLIGCGAPAVVAPTDVQPEVVSTTVPEVRPRPSLAGIERLVIHRGGLKMGSSVIEVIEAPGGGWLEKVSLVLEVKKDALTLRAERMTTTEYGADLELVRSSTVTREADVTSEFRAEFSGAKVTVHKKSVAHEVKKELEVPAEHRSELSVFHELRAEAVAGKAFPLSRKYRTLDEESLAFDERTVSLTARETTEGITGWRFESDDGELVTRGLLDDRGLPILVEPTGVVIAREGLKVAATTGVASFSSELPFEGKLAPARSRTVHVFVEDDPADAPAILKDSPYQKVTREAGRYVLALSAPRGELKQSPTLPFTGLAPEVERFSHATAMSQSEDPAIAALSAKIVAGEKNSRKAALAIAKWVYANLEKADGVRGAATAVETLQAKRGDCTEHTALVVALARAAGIPARAAGGIVLFQDKDGPTAGYHAWPELWVGEWVVLDAALGAFDVSANYLFLDYDEPGEPASDAMLRLLGKTRIVVP